MPFLERRNQDQDLPVPKASTNSYVDIQVPRTLSRPYATQQMVVLLIFSMSCDMCSRQDTRRDVMSGLRVFPPRFHHGRRGEAG